MPRVSQSHLDARRRQILDGALRCFTRRGFHTSSMQDVLSEIGLSAGAVYRYFSGKEEIIQAIAEELLRDFGTRLTSQVEQEGVPAFEDFVRQLPAVLAQVTDDTEAAGMMLQIWSEAPRSPGLSAVANSGFEQIVALLADVLTMYQERGELAADVAAEDYARVIVCALQGYVLQRAIFRTSELQAFQAAFGALVRSAGPPAA